MPSSQQAAALAWIMERQEVSPDKALQDLEEKLEQTEKQILEIDALERDDAANSQKQETKNPFKLTCELNAAIDVLKSIGHARLGSIDSIAPVLLNMLEAMYEKVSSGDGARQTLLQRCFGMVDDASTKESLSKAAEMKTLQDLKDKFGGPEATPIGSFLFSTKWAAGGALYAIRAFFSAQTKKEASKTKGKWLLLPLSDVQLRNTNVKILLQNVQDYSWVSSMQVHGSLAKYIDGRLVSATIVT